MEGARRKKRALPDWYKQRPAEVPESGPFFEAYNALTSCRRFEGGPIPHDSTMAYAGRKGLEPDVADALWTVIKRMDTAERQWRYDQLKAESGG